MARLTNPLDSVRVAAPCPADWSKMAGDERMRYCGECNLHVYNLSGMTRREAEALITNTEGRLCVRFYRRSDGTILTRNCPVGLRALKRRISRVAGATLTAVLGFFAGVGLNFGVNRAVAPPVVGEMFIPALDRPVVQGKVGRIDPIPTADQGQATVGMIGIRRQPRAVQAEVPIMGKFRRQSNLSK
jgi:hypothetical protein